MFFPPGSGDVVEVRVPIILKLDRCVHCTLMEPSNRYMMSTLYQEKK